MEVDKKALNPQLFEYNGHVRIERGPARKKGVATKEMMSNMATAQHYQFGARDADGDIIVEDKPFVYLDYLGEWVWYVYSGKPNDAGDMVWTEEATRPTMDDAENLALTFL